MEFKADDTVNKLIILYVLEKMEIPLTENSILEICTSQNNWVNYMDCKDLLYQLLKAKFIYKPNTSNNECRYNITYTGRDCLSQFFTKIPASLRDTISAFAKENKMHFKRNQEYVGNYFKNPDGSYSVEMRILEPLTTESLFEVKLRTDTRHSAIVACKKWREVAPAIYEVVYSKVIEEE